MMPRGFAITSIVLAIFGLPWVGIGSVAGVIVAHVALRRAKQDGSALRLPLAATVVSWFSVVIASGFIYMLYQDNIGGGGYVDRAAEARLITAIAICGGTALAGLILLIFKRNTAG